MSLGKGIQYAAEGVLGRRLAAHPGAYALPQHFFNKIDIDVAEAFRERNGSYKELRR
jgi:hypothetical protein